jgi:hypothetical protein
MRTAAFCASCAALGLFWGYLAMAAILAMLASPEGFIPLPSGRDAADFVADVESFLRAEGY